MRNKMKKLVVGILTLACTTWTFAGCAQKEAVTPETTNDAAVATTQEKTDIDISKKVELKMYLIGDKPADGDLVYGEMNKMLQDDLNATLDIEFLPWSDYKQMYSLILASGEEVDLIYTSDWCFYGQEAEKGAFVEVTDEILQKYMPETYKTQEKASWNQARRTDGKIYFVPKNASSFNNENVVVVRGDLREKYNIPELKSVDDLEAYFTAIAENEEGIFAYAGSKNNDYIRNLTFRQANDLVGYIGPKPHYFAKYEDGEMTAEQYKMLLEIPEYTQWAKRMRTWFGKGFWSKNAISNNTATKDAFINGTSAAMISNLGTAISNMDKVNKEHPDWKAEVFDITPNNIKMLGSYTGDGMAVAAASKNPERAFMVLDKLKNDRALHELWLYGIEGKHWIDLGDNAWKEGPDYEKYQQNSNCQWGVVNDDFKRIKEGDNPVRAEVENRWMKQVVHPINESFKFDTTEMKNENAAMGEVTTKYQALIEFGLMEDVETFIEEYKEELEKAGREKIETELYNQLGEYIDQNK